MNDCEWCGENHGTLAPVRFCACISNKELRILCTECRKLFAPEGWSIQLSDAGAQAYCKEQWEEVQ